MMDDYWRGGVSLMIDYRRNSINIYLPASVTQEPLIKIKGKMYHLVYLIRTISLQETVVLIPIHEFHCTSMSFHIDFTVVG